MTTNPLITYYKLHMTSSCKSWNQASCWMKHAINEYNVKFIDHPYGPYNDIINSWLPSGYQL